MDRSKRFAIFVCKTASCSKQHAALSNNRMTTKFFGDPTLHVDPTMVDVGSLAPGTHHIELGRTPPALVCIRILNSRTVSPVRRSIYVAGCPSYEGTDIGTELARIDETGWQRKPISQKGKLTQVTGRITGRIHWRSHSCACPRSRCGRSMASGRERGPERLGRALLQVASQYAEQL